MNEQKKVFLHGAGDAYFRRNAAEHERYHIAALADVSFDPVLRNIAALKPQRILEVGAADGWRLDVARQLWGAKGTGIEPSKVAVNHGRTHYPGITIELGTADVLPDGPFDAVIFGFCLYLCDRTDLFRIANEADRVLADEGAIVIYDFYPPMSYSNPYVHAPGVRSHKMDHSTLWSWHPSYVLWSHEVTAHAGKSPADPNERLAVTVLRKLAHHSS